MKRAREILLARHRAAEPALDAIRARAVGGLITRRERAGSPATFVEFLISLRWHAAAMSALWVLVALLGAGQPRPERGLIASGAASPSPLAYIIALREYSEELREANNPPAQQTPPPIPHACADPRRTRERNEIA
jgi:hypothetical protein